MESLTYIGLAIVARGHQGLLASSGHAAVAQGDGGRHHGVQLRRRGRQGARTHTAPPATAHHAAPSRSAPGSGPDTPPARRWSCAAAR